MTYSGGVYEGDIAVLEGGALQLDLKGYEGDKVIPLVVFATLGLAYVDLSNFSPANVSGGSGLGAVTASSVFLLWGLLGFESATVPADEVENPERTIPMATKNSPENTSRNGMMSEVI